MNTDNDFTACDTCGGTSHHQVAHKRNFDIRHCDDCRLYFVSPQPSTEELKGLYDTSQGYFATASSSLAETSPKKANKLDAVIGEYSSDRGRFLDIGCSSGKLIYHMRNLGWEVYGNDLNKGALDIARKHDLNVNEGILEECNYKDAYFDAIHLGDLVEHVPSPKRLFEEIVRIIKPGGIVTIVTPNADSGFARSSLLLSRILRISWAHSEAPHHLYDFSPTSIDRLLDNTGFDVEQIRYKDGGGFAYMIGNTGYFDDLKRKLKKDGRYRLSFAILPAIPMLIAVSTLLFPTWVIGRAMDRLNGSGKSMLVIGRRRD